MPRRPKSETITLPRVEHKKIRVPQPDPDIQADLEAEFGKNLKAKLFTIEQAADWGRRHRVDLSARVSACYERGEKLYGVIDIYVLRLPGDSRPRYYLRRKQCMDFNWDQYKNRGRANT